MERKSAFDCVDGDVGDLLCRMLCGLLQSVNGGYLTLASGIQASL